MRPQRVRKPHTKEFAMAHEFAAKSPTIMALGTIFVARCALRCNMTVNRLKDTGESRALAYEDSLYFSIFPDQWNRMLGHC